MKKTQTKTKAKIIRNKIKELRESLNLSIEELVQRMFDLGVEVTVQTIYLWEAQKQQPNSKYIPALMEVLLVNTPNHLFYFEENVCRNIQVNKPSNQRHLTKAGRK